MSPWMLVVTALGFYSIGRLVGYEIGTRKVAREVCKRIERSTETAWNAKVSMIDLEAQLRKYL